MCSSALMEASVKRVKREKVYARRENSQQVAGDEMEDGDGATRAAAGAPPRVIDRRLLRCRYREFQSVVNECKVQLAEADFSKFKDVVQRADSLHKQVSRPREQIRDAEVLNDITSEILAVAKNARMKAGMSTVEFVGAVLHKFGLPGDERSTQRSIDWEAFGMAASGIMLPAPGMSTMVGPMDVEPKVKKMPISRTRDRQRVTTRPKEVKEDDNDHLNTETDATIKRMFEALIALKRVPFDHLVFNRSSFPQTVENILALSFLAKDGRVEIRVSEDQKYYVAPRNAPSHAARAAAEVSNSQFVVSADLKSWEMMHETVPKGAEIMPHRDDASMDGSGAGAPGTTSGHTPIRKTCRNRARETPSADLASEDGGTRSLKRNLQESLHGSK